METTSAQPAEASGDARRNIVILGSGFAALNCAEHLHRHGCRIAVVSPRNHFLFTPLLPSTTVGTVEFRSIIEPVWRALHDRHTSYYPATCTAVNRDEKTVTCSNVFSDETFVLPYDDLVIAVGGVSGTHGIEGVHEHAVFLKELSDARRIRQDLIGAFERASVPGTDAETIRRLLHVVVVGGGPTGIEFAAELHDFIRRDIRKWFPDLVAQSRITLLEATDRILHSFDDDLTRYTLKRFRRDGIDVRTASMVEKVEKGLIRLKNGDTLACSLIVWSTGIGPTPFVRSLDLPKDKAGRLLTDRYFNIRGSNDIYAIGDCAVLEDENVPATAQVAQQEGKYLARILNERMKGRKPEPYHYEHLGMLAYVGGRQALVDTPKVKGKGRSAWLFWRSAYLTRIVSWKNKVLVLFDWMKTAVFGRDISRF